MRTKKLADGSESYYLDIYVDGKRSYEFLKLYLHYRTDPLEGRAEKDIRPFQNAAGRLDGNLPCRTGTKRRKRGETVTDGLPVASPLQEKGEDGGD